jgi:hypothetical protein
MIQGRAIGIYERTPAKPPAQCWQRVTALISDDDTHCDAVNVEWLRTLPTSELRKFG